MMSLSESNALVESLLSRCTFPARGTEVACAVSGGADSLALLVLAVRHGLEVTAHHVDHQIREDSHTDVDVVREVASQLGVRLHTHVVPIETGPNLEARAREARYKVMPENVMTGHTSDDQAETVLINLLRGAASQGLSAMTPGHQRPLLQLRRSETHQLCSSLSIDPVNDETNADTSFLRNSVRHVLLPMMNDMSKRDLSPILCRAADVLRDDNQLLEELASALDPTDAIALSQAPRPLATRAIRNWLAQPYPPDQATVDRVLDVAAGSTLACDVGGGREVRRSKQRLHLQKVR